jgi:NADH dehydrogenase
LVNDRLETSAPGLYAIGDCAACTWEGDKLVPARAQAAHQQASYLLATFKALLAERAPSAAFAYRDFGSLVSLGDNKGVGNLMGGLSGRNFFVEGLLAKWMYMSLHLNHHRAIVGLGNTIVLAVARLLQRRVSGRLKLH